MLLKAIKQLSRKDLYPLVVKFPDQTFQHLSQRHFCFSMGCIYTLYMEIKFACEKTWHRPMLNA